MEPLPRNNHVFVDCENIHEIDVKMISAKRVKFHFLYGATQKKLTPDIVEKIFQHSNAVDFIRLTSKGRNALDFTLSYYVGKTSVIEPGAIIHIVSKDGDFIPLVTHLQAIGVDAYRHSDFKFLSSLTDVPPITPSTQLAPPKTKQVKISPKSVISEKIEDYSKRALNHLIDIENRPKKQRKLIKDLRSYFGPKTFERDVLLTIEKLENEGKLKINQKEEITYNLPSNKVS